MTRVNLVQHVGGDASVVSAARASYNKEWDAYYNEKDGRLINYLMKHRHGTPFEHNLFTFEVHAPIFVAREWFRHRIGSFNEVSGRYAELRKDFYYPDHWRIPNPENKQGSIEHDDGYQWNEWCFVQSDKLDKLYEMCYTTYEEMIADGVAREQARMVLPVGIYTDFVWSVNARSLMNFLALRRAENAQQEIREYTPEIEKLFEQEMPVTYGAWRENGFVAP